MTELLTYKEACNRLAMGMAKSCKYYTADGRSIEPTIVQHQNGNFVRQGDIAYPAAEPWRCVMPGCNCDKRRTWILTEVPDETADERFS